jgi:hypothetical protein
VRRLGATAAGLTTRVSCAAALAALLLAASATAGPGRSTACPAPRPLPPGIAQPRKGAADADLARFLLALPQRNPCDVNLFTSVLQPGDWPGFYPEGTPMVLAPGVTPDEAEVRSRLAPFSDATSAAPPARTLRWRSSAVPT